MNLNFYNPNYMSNLENLQTNLQDQINKLDQLRTMNFNSAVQGKSTPTHQEQRYYLDCGNREDWYEFLRINYNLTENQIFSDYKLFLQAKAELNENQDKEKLEEMKRKISAPRGIDKEKGNVQYDIQSKLNQQQPVQSIYPYEQSIRNESMVPIQQPVLVPEQCNESGKELLQVLSSNPDMAINARNTSTATNQYVDPNVVNKLDKNTRNYEDKGVKHVR